MSDNVDSLLSQIQEQIDNGKRLGRLRLVDPMILQDLLESIRAAMPNVVERAKEIVAQRSEILDQAQREADATVAEARRAARELEDHTNERVNAVVQQTKDKVAQARADSDQIIAEAHAQAAQLVDQHTITQTAREQAEQMLRQARGAAEQMEAESRAAAERMFAQAQEYSQNLRRQTEEWGAQYAGGVRSVVEDIVNEAEDILASSLTDIRNTKKRLQAAMTKSAIAPAFDTPRPPKL
ncbi:MAG: hypothetical protein FWH26_04660 [Oscillospiraceae bacterium]|nr:hypothetical protein [Oscillospiraceae bacterium]